MRLKKVQVDFKEVREHYQKLDQRFKEDREKALKSLTNKEEKSGLEVLKEYLLKHR